MALEKRRCRVQRAAELERVGDLQRLELQAHIRARERREPGRRHQRRAPDVRRDTAAGGEDVGNGHGPITQETAILSRRRTGAGGSRAGFRRPGTLLGLASGSGPLLGLALSAPARPLRAAPGNPPPARRVPATPRGLLHTARPLPAPVCPAVIPNRGFLSRIPPARLGLNRGPDDRNSCGGAVLQERLCRGVREHARRDSHRPRRRSGPTAPRRGGEGPFGRPDPAHACAHGSRERSRPGEARNRCPHRRASRRHVPLQRGGGAGPRIRLLPRAAPAAGLRPRRRRPVHLRRL